MKRFLTVCFFGLCVLCVLVLARPLPAEDQYPIDDPIYPDGSVGSYVCASMDSCEAYLSRHCPITYLGYVTNYKQGSNCGGKCCRDLGGVWQCLAETLDACLP